MGGSIACGGGGAKSGEAKKIAKKMAENWLGISWWLAEMPSCILSCYSPVAHQWRHLAGKRLYRRPSATEKASQHLGNTIASFPSLLSNIQQATLISLRNGYGMVAAAGGAGRRPGGEEGEAAGEKAGGEGGIWQTSLTLTRFLARAATRGALTSTLST